MAPFIHPLTHPCQCTVLLMVTFVPLVPALYRSFFSAPCVVLGFFLTVLMICLTPWEEILCGAPNQGRLSRALYVFHFLIISPTVNLFTPFCLLIVDSLFPAMSRSTILVLCPSNLESNCILYTENKFKQVSLILVMSGGHKSFLKKLQVCSCLFVGEKIILCRNIQIL